MSFFLRNIRLPINQIGSFLKPNTSLVSCALVQKNFHISTVNQQISDFFDVKDNFGENEVKHGRAWLKPELRIKSNSDLHKLWYVLLKERNMLMTMEHECKRLNRYFPSPERIDKIKMSMENLESVVKERNQAYYELEVGDPVYTRENSQITTELGVPDEYTTKEYFIQKQDNKEWKKGRMYHGSNAISRFLRYYREKNLLKKTRARNRDRNEVIKLMSRFPNMNMKELREKYDTVDFDKIIRNDMARGHHVSK